MLTGEKVIPNGFYKFLKYISKKLKAKSSGNFQKGFENLTEEYFKYVNFLDFKDYEEFSLDKYGFENLKLIYTPGHFKGFYFSCLQWWLLVLWRYGSKSML